MNSQKNGLLKELVSDVTTRLILNLNKKCS